MPLELDAAPSELAAEQRLARAASPSTESCPAHWKGVCGFGENVETLAVTASRPPRRALHALGELGDAAHVVLGLARQTDHEVELQAPPAEVGEEPRGVEQLVLPVLLLDHVAQALRARLGREREAGLPHAPDLLEDGRGESASTRVDGSETATRSGASRSISSFSTGLTPL